MPDIENPQTFSEWYWRNSVDAVKARDTQYEIALSPAVAGVLAGYGDIPGISAGMKQILNGMQTPTQPEWATSIVKFVGEMGAAIGQRILGHEMKDFDYGVNSLLKNVRISDSVANALFLRKKITEDFWKERNYDAGYSDAEMRFNYESQKPYPAMPDIIAYARYNGVPDNPKDVAWKLFDIHPDDWPIWEFLSRQKLNTEQVLTLVKQGWMPDADATTELARLGWQQEDRQFLYNLAWTLPNPMLLVQGGLMRGLPQETLTNLISKADIHPAYADTYLDGILTKPASTDLIAYELRKDPTLSNLGTELRRIGIHPAYHDLYRQLAYPIPPVADIITMAVREAFTPEIAQRFGQYEGLPQEYVEWVQRKGISKEWAERYWAAHWSLPSPQQGFEMLHRGIINRDELHLLLRALDIMPFWRERLIQMSYRPLTRVDVRRMYQLGTLNEASVTQSYRELGYNDTNAIRMTDFTIRQTRQSLSRFSSNDVVQAFIKRFIDSGQAGNLLRQIGVKDTEIPYILQTAGYRREWSFKQERIDAIENLYKKGKLSETQTRTDLFNLGLPADHIQTLFQQWVSKAEADKEATWTTAQTLKFLQQGLITPERAAQELSMLGYNAERISIYLRSVPAKTG